MKQILAVILLGLNSTLLLAQSFSDGFSFYLPPDDTTSQHFLPDFPANPIDEDDFVSIAGGHFVVRGEPVRFWGANTVYGGAFPAPGYAGRIAGRLRKMGFNLLRFHHMDNPWNLASLFDAGSDTRHLNADRVNRLEAFLAALKSQGVYANINLHVSRQFSLLDGVADADSIPEMSKCVTIFDPQLIALQKEFARQLLSEPSSYTGLPLAHDPVMAMVEITNENSLYRFWRDDKLKHISKGGVLPMRHCLLLDSLWHAYLTDRYGDTDVLRQEWSRGTMDAEDDNLIRGGDFDSDPGLNHWSLEEHSPARASAVIDVTDPYEGVISARVSVTATDGENWHVQFKQNRISLDEDSLYMLNFAARADVPREIGYSVMKDDSPWTTYYSGNVSLDTDWQTFSASFRSSVTSDRGVRLSFHLARQTGDVWLDDIRLGPGSVKGLEEEEILEARNVRRIDFSEAAGYSDARVRDMSDFIISLQQDYFREMACFLREDLGVRVPIVGTNWNVGPADLSMQSELDYIDNHIYWDHPRFPGTPWSSTDWTISNDAMVLSQSGGTIPQVMGGVAKSGKPFTVSEYNHAFPNRYQSEGVLFLASYGAFHDVDGLMFFEYCGGDDWETDFVDGYFSIHRNTAMMALMPSCALAYRMGKIGKARQTLDLIWGEEQILTLPRRDDRHWQGPATWPKTLALQHAVRNRTFQGAVPLDLSSLPEAPSPPYASDTGELLWDPAGLFSATSGGFIGLTGFLDDFTGTSRGCLFLDDASGFGTFTWVALDGMDLDASGRSLMTLSTRVQNTGMIWDGENTVHNSWGGAPTEMEPLRLELTLDLNADSIRVWPLDERGKESTGFTVLPQGGRFDITLDQTVHPAVWFGIETFGISPASSGRGNPARKQELLLLDSGFPNPLLNHRSYHMPFQLLAPARINVSVYNVLGQRVWEVNKHFSPGAHEIVWNGFENTRRALGSGYYFVVFESRFGEKRQKRIHRLLVMK